MAKKRETIASALVREQIQKQGWFRNISDRVQVGIPDFLGCVQGRFVGLEVKAVGEVPPDGWAPSSKEHRFSKKQVEELFSIERNKGVALGIVVCGKLVFIFSPEDINENGQVDCFDLIKRGQSIKMDKLGETLQEVISGRTNFKKSTNVRL